MIAVNGVRTTTIEPSVSFIRFQNQKVKVLNRHFPYPVSKTANTSLLLKKKKKLTIASTCLDSRLVSPNFFLAAALATSSCDKTHHKSRPASGCFEVPLKNCNLIRL